ncbi:hypothetical protein FRB94_001476, partial [Tulasnella sp. JGI-2019a]
MWARILATASIAFSSVFFSVPEPDNVGLKQTVVSERFGTTLRLVKNSGICETTPGVQTVSGYIDIGNNQSYWFWFFAARHNASAAPFVLWFNGGPGCSSMIGLFQENGPCKVNSDQKTTTLNRNSWNEVANVLYIDQPIGTGFSHGAETTLTSDDAAGLVWQTLQAFLENFPVYEGRELILATESYGGHYGPAFVTVFNSRNALIRRGVIEGEIIIVSALMLNNGWIDPGVQYSNYPSFAANPPGYDPIVPDSVIRKAYTSLLQDGGCMDQIRACNAVGGSNN